jgi:hypothetical protein
MAAGVAAAGVAAAGLQLLPSEWDDGVMAGSDSGSNGGGSGSSDGDGLWKPGSRPHARSVCAYRDSCGLERVCVHVRRTPSPSLSPILRLDTYSEPGG